MKTYITKDINETHNWAADFAKILRAPVTVALHGDLGVGKSEIARTIIQTLCGADTVRHLQSCNRMKTKRVEYRTLICIVCRTRPNLLKLV